MRLRVLITAGSSGAAWYLANEIRNYFSSEITLIVGDIYPEFLSTSAAIADEYIKLPLISSRDYYSQMIDILKKHHIDVIVPIIDDDLFYFASDNPELERLHIRSTAPKIETIKNLTDKRAMEMFLNGINVATPKVVKSYSEIDKDSDYIIKPDKGHGSIGLSHVKGAQIPLNYDFRKNIVQKSCDINYGEISADTFVYKDICKAYIRKREEVKSGVCVKMIPIHGNDEKVINDAIQRINASCDLPLSSCIQFMKDSSGAWNVIDCNLRLGAGTALSDAAGFHIARALLLALLGKEIDCSILTPDNNVKSVLREYTEIVVR